MTSKPARPRTTGPRYELSVITRLDELRRSADEWNQLFIASASINPFANPAWLIVWAERYSREGDLCILQVRAEGQLIAIAPFHRTASPLKPIGRQRAGRVLRLLGTGRGAELTELPEILLRDPSDIHLMPIIVRGLIDLVQDWDWLELTLNPEQGWFDPEWIAPIGNRPRAFPLHKGTRACVVAPLAQSWDAQRSALGRNVRESIRRGENRLRRAGHEWRLEDEFLDAAALRAAVDNLVALHRTRAALRRGPRHESCLERSDARAFLRDAIDGLAATGHASPVQLVVDGEPVAVRLLLHAGSSTYFSLSGFDPAWWDFGVATTLVAEAIRGSIRRGDTTMNLSTGPERSKLRWSRQLRLYEDFYVVRTERRSRIAFAGYWTTRAPMLLHRQRRLHAPLESGWP